MLKTADLQDFIYTSMDDDKNVTPNSFYLHIPNLIPSVETQLMFKEATQNLCSICFDEWHTERRKISNIIARVDIGSAQQVNSPKSLIRAHQTKDRLNTSDKKIILARFDNLNLRKYHVEIDSQRYPRDSVHKIYKENDYIEPYKD